MGCKISPPATEEELRFKLPFVEKTAVGQRYYFYMLTKDASEISILGLTARGPETARLGFGYLV